MTLCIPWGDISTARRNTEFPTSRCTPVATAKMISNAKRSRYLNWLLRRLVGKKHHAETKLIKPAGPSDEKLETGRSFLWGKTTDASGKSTEARLETQWFMP